MQLLLLLNLQAECIEVVLAIFCSGSNVQAQRIRIVSIAAAIADVVVPEYQAIASAHKGSWTPDGANLSAPRETLNTWVCSQFQGVKPRVFKAGFRS